MMRSRFSLGALVSIGVLSIVAGCTGRGSSTLPDTSTNAPLSAARVETAATAVTPAPNFLGYISYYWGNPKQWTINCDYAIYYPPHTCLVVNAPNAKQLGGPPLAANDFVAIYADPKTAGAKGITALSFRTAWTPFQGGAQPRGYSWPSPGPTPPATNFLGYISYYWGDRKQWTINCDGPTYYAPNTCLVVNASRATQSGGPAPQVGEFVAIAADPKTAGPGGITALVFATSFAPFPGSPIPPTYATPTPGPSPIPTVTPPPLVAKIAR
jgi:hypothetical protein